MKIKICGALLCAVLALLPIAASAIHGSTAIIAILALKTQAGAPFTSGKTDKNGIWTSSKLLPAGAYTLDIPKLPVTAGDKTASITIRIGGQQDVVRSAKGLVISTEGGRETIMTVPLPNSAFSFKFQVGQPMTPSEPRTFTVTIQTVPAP